MIHSDERLLFRRYLRDIIVPDAQMFFVRGSHPITSEMLTELEDKTWAAWLGALILADGECSYMSAPINGRRYSRARVRIGIYEREPIDKAAKLMGVSLMGPRKGRFEAEAQGSRAVAVLTKIGPYILGRKSREADYIIQNGGRVAEQVYRDFQQRFPSLRRMRGKMASEKKKVLRAGMSEPKPF